MNVDIENKRMDKKKLDAINWKEFLKYPFVKDFLKNLKDEELFRDNLKKFIEGSSEFRKKTGTELLTDNDLVELTNYLKNLTIRRRLLKGLGLGAALVGGVAVTRHFGFWPFKKKTSQKINPKKLYSQISKIPNLKPVRNPIFSNDTNAPLIILIEDVHMGLLEFEGWDVEFQQLELLRKNFGFNFVGVEGWAGHEADKARGRQILNAEVPLIRELLVNKNYEVVGLEQEGTQIELFEILLVEEYIQLYKIESRIEYYKRNLYNKKPYYISNEITNIIFNSIYSHFENMNEETFLKYETFDSEKVHKESEKIVFKHFPPPNPIGEFLDREVYWYMSTLYDMIPLLRDTQGIQKFTRKAFKTIEASLRVKHSQLFKFAIDTKKSIYEHPEAITIVDKKREEFAVSNMLSSMNKKNKNVGIVVFGRSHTDGLVRTFINISGGRINIIVIE